MIQKKLLWVYFSTELNILVLVIMSAGKQNGLPPFVLPSFPLHLHYPPCRPSPTENASHERLWDICSRRALDVFILEISLFHSEVKVKPIPYVFILLRSIDFLYPILTWTNLNIKAFLEP